MQIVVCDQMILLDGAKAELEWYEKLVIEAWEVLAID